MKIKPATPEAYKLFHEGMIALSQIEANGIRIDVKRLDETIERVDKEIKVLERELRDDKVFAQWWKRYGEKSGLGSHEQLGHIVFDVLGYKRNAKARSGKNDESAFESVDNEFVKKWFRWQKRNKLRGTYLLGIRSEVEGEYLHPNFNLNTVTTYRGSCDSPNFQNIPVRNPEISEIIRSCFIAREGHLITENDFGGIEVRVATCYNEDPVMIRYIKEGYDYHKQFAAQCYKIDPDKVSKAVRYCGKNMFVFPEFYGSYYIDCCRNLWEATTRMKLEVDGVSLRDHLKNEGITSLGKCNPEDKPKKGTFERHIADVERQLWDTFKVYAQWKIDWYNQYLKRGWLELKTGFIVSGILRRNESVNYPVQGAAFHCLLWVLIELQKWLRKYKMRSKIVGQIHDSIIGDVHARELDDYLAKVKHLVEVALPKHWPWVIVPMEIEAEIASEGKSWHDKKAVQI